MRKRILAIALTIVMLLSCFPAAAFAADDRSDNSNETTAPAEEWVYEDKLVPEPASMSVTASEPAAAVSGSANSLEVHVIATARETNLDVSVPNATVMFFPNGSSTAAKTVTTDSNGKAYIPIAGYSEAELRNSTVSAYKTVAYGDGITGTGRDALFSQLPKKGGENLRYELELHSERIDANGNWIGQKVPVTTSTGSGNVDVVFAIDATGSMGDEINNVKNNIMDFSKDLISRGLNVRFSIIEYRDITCGEPTILHSYNGSHWYTKANAVQSVLSDIYADGGGDGPETVIDALGMAAGSEMYWRSNAAKFVFVLTDADYKTNNNYGYSSLSDVSKKLKEKGIVVSVCTSSSYSSTYNTLYSTTGGVYLNIYSSDFKSEMLKLADSVAQTTVSAMTLKLSEPRLKFNLTCCYLADDSTSRSSSYRQSVINMLNHYALNMAQATDGHVIIDNVLLFSTGNRVNFYNTSNVASMADIRIETSESDSARIHSNAYVTGFYSADTVTANLYYDEGKPKGYLSSFADFTPEEIAALEGRRTFRRIIMSGTEGAGWNRSLITQPESYSTTVTHESGHYLLGFWDEYLNQDDDKWRDIGGKPTDAYGLMDNQHENIEMSRTMTDYSYFHGTFPTGRDSKHTRQSYKNGDSCEDTLARMLTTGRISKKDSQEYISVGSYVGSYSKATNPIKDRTASYPYAALTNSHILTLKNGATSSSVAALSANAADDAYFDALTRDDGIAADLAVTSNGTDAIIRLPSGDPATAKLFVRTENDDNFELIAWTNEAAAELKELSDEVCEELPEEASEPAEEAAEEVIEAVEPAEEAVEEALEPEEALESVSVPGSCYAVIPGAAEKILEIRIEDTTRDAYSRTYVDVAPTVDFGYIYNSVPGGVMAYAVTSEPQAFTFSSSAQSISTGEYHSVNEVMAFRAQNDAALTRGEVVSVASGASEIDYSSAAWFYFNGSEWRKLETTQKTDESNNISSCASLCGSGLYVLMAKDASAVPAAAPVGLVCTPSETVEGMVTLSFTDTNSGTKFYNVYYSDSAFTTGDEAGVAALRFDAGSTELTVDLHERGRSVNLAVEIVLENGARSPLSFVSVVTPEVDSDGDGIPDWYADKYNLWPADGKEKDIAASDDDSDGLTNLEEYLGGSDPLDPDDPVKTTREPVQSIKLDTDSAELVVGESMILSAAVYPEDATDQEIIWNTSDEYILRLEPDGSRCRVTAVGEGFAVVTATSHDGGYAEECEVSVSIYEGEIVINTPDYLILENEPYTLGCTVEPEFFADQVEWVYAENIPEEGEGDVIALFEDGTVYPLRRGTAFVDANIYYLGRCYTSRTRIDVTGEQLLDELTDENISLSTAKATAELYKTDYAPVEVFIVLRQNLSTAASTGDGMPIVMTENLGAAITSARFEEPAAAEMFDIAVRDDSTLLIVPTEYAVNNPKAVKSSYSSKIVVNISGEEFTAPETLKLTVKKTMPKLKVSSVSFNSFYTRDTAELNITGATVDWLRTEAVSVPEWLRLENGTLSMVSAPDKASGKLALNVWTEEWAIPVSLTVSVKLTRTLPKLKSTVTSFTFANEFSGGQWFRLASTDKKVAYEDMNVSGVIAPEGMRIVRDEFEPDLFMLIPDEGFAPGKTSLGVTFTDTDAVMMLPITLKAAAVTLKPSVSKLTLRTDRPDSASFVLTSTPVDYTFSSVSFRVTDAKNNPAPDALDIFFSGYDHYVTVFNTEDTVPGTSYKVWFRAGEGKESYVTVTALKETAAAPSVSLKVTGAVDTTYRYTPMTVTPTFRNCGGNESELYGFTVMASGKGYTNDVTHMFRLYESSGKYELLVNGYTPDPKLSYKLTLNFMICGDQYVTSTVSFKVKHTAVGIKLSKSSVTINPVIYQGAEIKLIPTIKDYSVESIYISTTLNGKYVSNAFSFYFNYATSTFRIEPNNCQYGKTYKVSISAGYGEPAKTLSVTIPKYEKCVPGCSLKVKGNIDPIRNSTVTLSPTFTNVPADIGKTYSFTLYRNGSNVTYNADFDLTDERNIKLTYYGQAELSDDFRISLRTYLATGYNVYSTQVKIPVKTAKAKLSLTPSTVTLNRRDIYSRAEIIFTTKDTSLKAIDCVEFKNPEQAEQFSIISEYNGKFYIAFNGDPPATGKAVSIPLNVFFAGNFSDKPDATVTLKVQFR